MREGHEWKGGDRIETLCQKYLQHWWEFHILAAFPQGKPLKILWKIASAATICAFSPSISVTIKWTPFLSVSPSSLCWAGSTKELRWGNLPLLVFRSVATCYQFLVHYVLAWHVGMSDVLKWLAHTEDQTYSSCSSWLSFSSTCRDVWFGSWRTRMLVPAIHLCDCYRNLSVAYSPRICHNNAIHRYSHRYLEL